MILYTAILISWIKKKKSTYRMQKANFDEEEERSKIFV